MKHTRSFKPQLWARDKAVLSQRGREIADSVFNLATSELGGTAYHHKSKENSPSDRQTIFKGAAAWLVLTVDRVRDNDFRIRIDFRDPADAIQSPHFGITKAPRNQWAKKRWKRFPVPDASDLNLLNNLLRMIHARVTGHDITCSEVGQAERQVGQPTEQWKQIACSCFKAAERIVHCPGQKRCNTKFGRQKETPQLRPLGHNYLPYRIAVISENPGGNLGRKSEFDAVLMDKFEQFAEEATFGNWKKLNTWLIEHALPDFSKGKYVRFLQEMGIASAAQVAHVVVANCRTDNENKKQMLSHCFQKHTKRLILDVLQPYYAIAIGKTAYAHVRGMAKPRRFILRASLHWAQKDNENRARRDNRVHGINQDLAMYVQHVDSGKDPLAFDGDPDLTMWPE